MPIKQHRNAPLVDQGGQKKRSLHVGLLCPDLSVRIGGRELFCVNLANAMIARGHQVTLFVPGSAGKPLHYSPDTRAQIVYISMRYEHELINEIRETLRSSSLDVCVAVETFWRHLFWAVAALGSGVPYIYSERSYPEYVENSYWNRKGRLAAMSGADAIHLLVPEYAASLPDFLRERAVVIGNPAPVVGEVAVCGKRKNTKKIISLGGMTECKQTHLLIEAFALLAPHFPEWRLDVWGDGPCAPALQQQAALSPFTERIALLGYCEEPLNAFASADLFCIPSNVEGFPNAVVEALACGLPVVGYADCPGVNHLIRPGENGLLAPEMTVQSLADTLALIMRDEPFRAAMSANAPKTVKCFAQECIFEEWEKLFYRVAACRGNTRMDSFFEEPFASMARLSAAARREYLFRDFGMPYPGTARYFFLRARNTVKRLCKPTAVADLRKTLWRLGMAAFKKWTGN